MPGTLAPSVTGYLAFGAVKLAGYSLFSIGLSRAYKVKRNPLVVGGARTVLGMVVGTAYFGLWYLLGDLQTNQAAYLLGLIPIRMGEWWLLVWLFFDRGLLRLELGWRMVTLGIVWSYVCDLPALLGYLATGGFEVC